jgi:Flp pilus assembly protein TadD
MLRTMARVVVLGMVIGAALLAALPVGAQAIRCDLTSAADFVARGQSSQNTGDYTSAIDDFTCALELDVENTDALFGRAYSLQALGENDRAERDYTALLELDPNNPHAYNNRGNIYYNRGEFNKARADYDRAIALDNPNKDTAYANRGHLLYHTGDLVGAIKDFTHALELNPDDREIYFSRGYAYDDLGETEKATQDYLDWLSRGSEVYIRSTPNRLQSGIELDLQEGWYYRFPVTVGRGQMIRAQAINLTDPVVDTFLFLFDPKGKLILWADDTEDSLDSLLTYTATSDGEYTILVTHAGGGSYGRFELTVKVSNTL